MAISYINAAHDACLNLGFSPRKTNFLQQLRPRFLYWSLTYTGVCDLTQLHTLEQSQGRIGGGVVEGALSSVRGNGGTSLDAINLARLEAPVPHRALEQRLLRRDLSSHHGSSTVQARFKREIQVSAARPYLPHSAFDIDEGDEAVLG